MDYKNTLIQSIQDLELKISNDYKELVADQEKVKPNTPEWNELEEAKNLIKDTYSKLDAIRVSLEE